MEDLCRRYTDLSGEEIALIGEMAGRLQQWADQEHVDAFINCPSQNGDSVVVAQAGPAGAESAYRHSVVGMLSKPVNEPAVARTLQLGCITRRMRAVNQERVPVVQVAAPIRMGERVIGALTYERPVGRGDIPDPLAENYREGGRKKRRQNPDDGRGSDWSWLAEYIDEGLLMVDTEGYVSYRNTVAKRLYVRLGYMEDILGQKYRNIRLADLPENGSAPPVEAEVGRFILSVRQVRIQESGEAFAVIIKDITNQKAAERELVLKSMVVQEMHHRVKNNLQTISSLLRLQRSRAKSGETKQVLTETGNRILAIAATHQLLAQNGMDQVMLKEVLENIRNNVLRAYNPAQTDVRVEIHGGAFAVSSDVAASVALVTNELLQNCLQHAFTGRGTGSIEILIREEKLYGTICVADDGVGFDKGRENLGLSIVRSLVREKLRGSLDIATGPAGTRVQFDFQI